MSIKRGESVRGDEDNGKRTCAALDRVCIERRHKITKELARVGLFDKVDGRVRIDATEGALLDAVEKVLDNVNAHFDAKPVNRPLTTSANPVFSMYIHVGNSGYRFTLLRASRTDADGNRQQYPVFSVSSDFFGHTDEKVLRMSRENMAALGALLIAASEAEFTGDHCESGRLHALSMSTEIRASLDALLSDLNSNIKVTPDGEQHCRVPERLFEVAERVSDN